MHNRLNSMRQDVRAFMTEMFSESMRCIDVRNVLIHRMSLLFGRLQIDKVSYKLSDFHRIILVAVGKAAVPMCSTVAEILRPGLRNDQVLTGIAVGPRLDDPLPREVRYFPGNHPFPDQTSRTAAEAARELLSLADSHDLVLFLISGGASS